MALSKTLAARRIKAARIAAGLKQEELERLSYEANTEEFGKGDVGRMEREEGPGLGPGRAKVLAQCTGFPTIWFTEPNLEVVFSEPAIDPRLAQLEDRLNFALEAVGRLAGELLETDGLDEFQRWWSSDPRSGELGP